MINSRVDLLNHVLELLLKVLSTGVGSRLEREPTDLLRNKPNNDRVEHLNDIEALALVVSERVGQLLEHRLGRLVEVALVVGTAGLDEGFVDLTNPLEYVPGHKSKTAYNVLVGIVMLIVKRQEEPLPIHQPYTLNHIT